LCNVVEHEDTRGICYASNLCRSEPKWPKLQVLGSFRQFAVLAFAWPGIIPQPHRPFFERPWLEGNITMDRGPLACRIVQEENQAAAR
jgi:hypothetical protein